MPTLPSQPVPFTLEQLQAAHGRVKSGADFPRYVQDMERLGVVAYDYYVSDGHHSYRGREQVLTTVPVGEPLPVAPSGNREALQQALTVHQQGRTDYPTFCRQAAAAGVDKWTVRTLELTCSYYDVQGQEMLVEEIPLPGNPGQF
ncbi:uncharacterized protein YbcV (DUF1398 family) [Neolewinella xylanilytica]|uniref:Uncharacterized protein YbcV (DUF1398 family) n=1 Tax=Neolewinella xylanilytica TaxID=1514080 RepID=A0A2S6I9M9_9BACT|nr:DUF1398 family protein [Neolewinella xylanilytica]PPK88182.1 uncharacterized protein YbcV (DUF1398 family) [Neolewinella xylanilytica]